MQYLIKFSTHKCKLDYREITFVQKISDFVQLRRFFDISAMSVYFNSNDLAGIAMTEITLKLLSCSVASYSFSQNLWICCSD